MDFTRWGLRVTLTSLLSVGGSGKSPTGMNLGSEHEEEMDGEWECEEKFWPHLWHEGFQFPEQ